MREWASTILETGVSEGYWTHPGVEQVEERFRPGDSDVEELCAAYGRLTEATDWTPEITREAGIERTIRWFAENRSRWEDRVDWR